MQKKLFIALSFAALLLPEVAVAQYYSQSPGYYQPRVYNSPPPRYSRDAYIAGGNIVGGVTGGAAGSYFGPAGSGYGATVGGAAGGYYGGRMYDNQSQYMQQRYYAPPAYGIQSTTPYMMRTVPRR